MKTFTQWCEETNRKLPSLTEQPPTDNVSSESQSAMRAAVRSHAYPELYGRGQYPPGYFRPIAADAVTYQDKS